MREAGMLACASGLSEAHLIPVPDGHALTAATAAAFNRLVQRARSAGFDLAIASSWRSYDRQLAIFNGKATGARRVHDDAGIPIEREDFSDEQWLERILRFSALPGASRHHWGTDLDVYDRAAVTAEAPLELSPNEYGPGGPQYPLASWLREYIAREDAEGFYLPYADDRGGVAPEPWHLSFATEAKDYAAMISSGALVARWAGEEGRSPLALLPEVMARLEEIWARFVQVA